MQCRACSAPLEAHVFPGGVVRCACGVDNVAPDPRATPSAPDPARALSPPVPRAPPPPAPGSNELGPLCPRCTRLLHDDPEQAALACDRCGGVFVDHAVLAARIETEHPGDLAAAHVPPRPRRPESEVHYAWCPRCRKVMARMTFGKRSGIVVDVCEEHGTWFDAGELDGALAFVRAGGLEVERQELAPAADAEARALQARLAVELLGDGHRQAERVEDLAYFLMRQTHVGMRGPMR